MNHRIPLIKKIDEWLGALLVGFIPQVKFKVPPESITKILVIRPGGMGDAALLLPVLKMVRKHYPDLTIDVLCESRNAGIFHSVTWLDSIRLYDHPLQALPVIGQSYDMIIDTEQSHYLSAVMCRFLKSRFSLGFKWAGREKMFHQSVAYDHDTYETTMFHKLVGQGIPLPDEVEWLFPFFRQPKHNENSRVDLTTSHEKRVICLFPGASVSERLWTEGRWVDVINALGASGFQPVLLGGGMEMDACQSIEGQCRIGSVINMAGKLSLLETAWLFERASLLISTDSGILHLGVLAGISTVSLFGSGIAKKWAPQGENHVVINKKLLCSSCTIYGTTPPCPNENACMLSITSEDVLQAASILLNESKE